VRLVARGNNSADASGRQGLEAVTNETDYEFVECYLGEPEEKP